MDRPIGDGVLKEEVIQEGVNVRDGEISFPGGRLLYFRENRFPVISGVGRIKGAVTHIDRIIEIRKRALERVIYGSLDFIEGEIHGRHQTFDIDEEFLCFFLGKSVDGDLGLIRINGFIVSIERTGLRGHGLHEEITRHQRIAVRPVIFLSEGDL